MVDYPVGSGVWSVLQVRAVDGIADFYRDVLGWRLDLEGNSGRFMCDDHQVAELRIDPKLADNEVGWVIFLGTDDLEATLVNATGAGATIDKRGRELGARGQAAELIDPFGVRFGIAVLEPGQAILQSTKLGHLVLVDPTNHNAETQIAFQTALFPGGTVDRMDHHINIIRDNDGLALRGAYALEEEMHFIPPHWLPWFSVADQGAAVEAAVAAGGRINTRDNDLSFGIWGVVVDPQGGEFKTLQMTKDRV